MKVNNVLCFIENGFILKNKKQKELITYKVNKGIVSKGKIVNLKKFTKEYELFLAKYNLNKAMIGETIKIIVNHNYTSTDIETIKNLFLSFNYRKVQVTFETKCLNITRKNAYIVTYDNYQTIYFLDEYNKLKNIIIESDMFQNSSDLMKYIKYLIKDKELYLLGDGELLKVIFNNFEELFDNKTYIFSNHERYLIERAPF